MWKKINDYFSLWGKKAILGSGGVENRRQVILFVGVAIGAASKSVYDAFVADTTLRPGSLVVALIASVVVFPQLYYTGGLDKKELSFAHFALAFQNGFFWSIALDQIAKHLGSN
jgi:hypothetical protein